MHSILSHLLRPLKGGAPSLIIIFAIGLALAEKSGWAGLPLSLILSSWYWKYAFVLFDHTVRGLDEPPALDIEMVNPVDEQRPLAQLCIFGALYLLCNAVYTRFGAIPGLLITSLFVLSTPASVAALGLDGNPLRAMYPPVLLHIVRSLGGLYVLIIAVTAGYILLSLGIFKLDIWRPIQLILALFLGLSLFSLLAGALYDRRDELGLEVWRSPEKKQARLDAEDRRESQRTVDTAYGQARSAKHVDAWATLSAWLEKRGHRFEDYDWLIERIRPWMDPRFLTRVTEDYIDRLLAANRNGDALQTAATALRHDPSFRPKTAGTTLRLAHIAASGGSPKVARQLLADFASRFPDDPDVKPAEALAHRLGS